jgi:hypothetical protein
MRPEMAAAIASTAKAEENDALLYFERCRL